MCKMEEIPNETPHESQVPGDREALADKLERAVEDFVERLHSDHPMGPDSELGGEVPGRLRIRSNAEHRRLAALGKAMIDEFEATHRL
jgi:hypothetical protein